MSNQAAGENRVITRSAGVISRRSSNRRPFTKRSRAISRRKEQMGGAVTVQAEDPPKPPIQEDNSFQKVQKLSELNSTWTLPEKADLQKVCPDCHTLLSPVLDTSGQAKPLLQCLNCPMLACEHCLYPCPTGACTNQSCHFVSFLLSCDQVTDRTSNVFGCPQFRACPQCHSMMMHERGCKYVTCCTCKHRYCFICLRSGKVCAADGNHYWTLSCSVPSAPRQRFQT